MKVIKPTKDKPIRLGKIFRRQVHIKETTEQLKIDN